MTLDDIICIGGIMIQGDVRLSVWKGDEETMINEIRGTENLNGEKIKKYLSMEVTYMFASPDGFLHIELTPKD